MWALFKGQQVFVLLPLMIACTGAPDVPSPTPTQRGAPTPRAADASARTGHTPSGAPTFGPLPTAVRVFSADPDELVLRPHDVPEAFRLSYEYPVVEVEFSRSATPGTQPPLRGPLGSGRQVVLVSDNARASQGVVSIATTVVRYETTLLAAAAFARAATAMAGVRAYTPAADQAGIADEVRAWQYWFGGALIEEVLFRTRNYVLGVIVVMTSSPPRPTPGFRYAQLLRSKLPA
jgi:hypothetical protein